MPTPNRRTQTRSAATTAPKNKACFFCISGYTDIDYKDATTLRKYTSSYAKILPKRKSGVCSKHQRKLAQAIKRARIIALLPFVNQ
jgi:small subunit ribosomal protein S18